MDRVIDFTNCKKRKKSFGGANGSKISIQYNHELYMLKFSSKSKRNKNISYKLDTNLKIELESKITESVRTILNG